MGNGCGTVGGSVASDTSYPQFKFSHRQFYLLSSSVLNKMKRKDKVKKKEVENWPICLIRPIMKLVWPLLFYVGYLPTSQVNTNTSKYKGNSLKAEKSLFLTSGILKKLN